MGFFSHISYANKFFHHPPIAQARDMAYSLTHPFPHSPSSIQFVKSYCFIFLVLFRSIYFSTTVTCSVQVTINSHLDYPIASKWSISLHLYSYRLHSLHYFSKSLDSGVTCLGCVLLLPLYHSPSYSRHDLLSVT